MIGEYTSHPFRTLAITRPEVVRPTLVTVSDACPSVVIPTEPKSTLLGAAASKAGSSGSEPSDASTMVVRLSPQPIIATSITPLHRHRPIA